MFFRKLRLQKNDRFRYIPRYYKGLLEDNSFEIKSKYSREEQALNYNDFKGQWARARDQSRSHGNYQVTTRLIVIIVILVLLFLYVIGFDLSIFRK